MEKKATCAVSPLHRLPRARGRWSGRRWQGVPTAALWTQGVLVGIRGSFGEKQCARRGVTHCTFYCRSCVHSG